MDDDPGHRKQKQKMLEFQDLKLGLQDFAINHGLLPVETILPLNLLVRYLITFLHLQMNRRMDNLIKISTKKQLLGYGLGVLAVGVIFMDCVEIDTFELESLNKKLRLECDAKVIIWFGVFVFE